jgi:Delta7-sterol 5-desaturase
VPFSERLIIVLMAIPAASIERAIWYGGMAGFAYLTLHVLFAGWLRGRRISPKPIERSQIRTELLCSLRSLAIYGLVGGAITFAVLSGWTPMYFRIEHYGWSWFIASIGVTILIHDAYFYWTHRLMHHPRLFRAFHATHHLSTNPSPWAAYSFSAPEAFVQAGIAPLVIMTVPIHPLAFSIFMIWQIALNVLGHCGYELYPRWFLRSPLGCLFNTTTHHAQHHETNRANFSLYFNYWDWLMGTNHARYAERFEEATGQRENAAT